MEVSVSFTTPNIKIDPTHDQIIVIPLDGSPNESGTYYSSAPSLLKHLNRSGVKTSYLVTPTSLFEQRGAEWFGPTLLILHSLYNANPDILNLLFDALKEHIKNLYPSDSTPKIILNISLYKDNNSQSTDIHFEGPTESFPELLKTIQDTWGSK